MIYEKEADFEEAVITVLKQHGWKDGVLKYPTEADLLQNWANILYNNNKDKDRLDKYPLTTGEMEQIIEQINALKTPYALNDFINGKTVQIKRDNADDKEHFGKEVSLKIYDRKEICGGMSTYQIAEQPVYSAKNKMLNDRRGDLCLLINGMPVIHMELKRSGVSISQACNQIEKYAHEGVFSGVFALAQIFVAMNPDDAVYFANPGVDKFNPSYYFHWADSNNEPYCAGKNLGKDEWKDFIEKLLNIPMAHQLIGFYTVADSGDGCLKVLRSYQYYAAHAISDTVSKCEWDSPVSTGTLGRLGGYVWHTTGSGKTMTSFKAAQLVADSNDADKVVFLMDRIELGTQSLKEYRAFADNEDDVQATENTEVLKHKLIESDDPKDILIVTSIQKMSNIHAGEGGITKNELERMESKRVVFILDECHRSTFGTMLQDIRKSFPNALYFGFTGTPIKEENQKKGVTTSMIFGDELHRYSIADGIRDGNVLGFDPYMVLTFRDKQVREEIALKQVNAKYREDIEGDPKKEEVYYYFMHSVPMASYIDETGKRIKGIEDYLRPAQYGPKTPHEHVVIEDIVDQFPILSRGNKFHALLATSSISEAISYYRRIKERAPQLKCTALFDPNIDNNEGAIVKEDALIEIISDYNETYGKDFSIRTWAAMKKDISARLAHKKPYLTVDTNRDERIDILIVVDQMLTGFDSKWVNTLYLDKVIEYESIIQAFSRTNRIFGSDKPFGIIRYYRRPHTMRSYIEKAVKLYSGDKKLDLFVQKLPQNIALMDARLLEIKMLFEANGVGDLSRLPELREARQKFSKDFIELSRVLKAAQLQGFSWKKDIYEFKNVSKEDKEMYGFDLGAGAGVVAEAGAGAGADAGADAADAATDAEADNCLIVKPTINERTYLTLVQRYKELFEPAIVPNIPDIPYELDGHLTEIDTGRIDTDYMNVNFVKWLKALEEDEESAKAVLEELHRSFVTLSQDEQKFALLFIHDVERGEAKLEEGKTMRDYITSYARRDKDEQVDKVVSALGVDKELLLEMMALNLNEKNINEYGRFDRLKDSINKAQAQEYFESAEKTSVPLFRVNVKAADLLRRFILNGGFDIDTVVLSFTQEAQ